MRDTIELAREAGFPMAWISDNDGGVIRWKDIKAFADLIRADEREACAKVCESEAEMFKSCAYGANDGRYDWKEDGARDCAAAIRARGNT
jgi:hypothetical protein